MSKPKYIMKTQLCLLILTAIVVINPAVSQADPQKICNEASQSYTTFLKALSQARIYGFNIFAEEKSQQQCRHYKVICDNNHAVRISARAALPKLRLANDHSCIVEDLRVEKTPIETALKRAEDYQTICDRSYGKNVSCESLPTRAQIRARKQAALKESQRFPSTP